jgi:hypothetical protein
MSGFFDSESLRAETARDIMKRYGIGVAADTIDGYRTDGDVRRNGFAELILE